MPRIANPIISPIGQAFDGVTKMLLGMPSLEERGMRESQARLMDAQREKAINDAELGRRKIGAIDGIGGVFSRMNGPIPTTEVPRPSEDMQGPMPAVPAMSRDQHVQNQLADAFRTFAALNPEGAASFGAGIRALIANTGGASPTLVSNAMLGAGDSEGSTPRGFGNKLAQDDRQHHASLGNQFAIAKMGADKQAILERQAQQAQEGRTLLDVDTPQGRRTMTLDEWKQTGVGEAPRPATDMQGPMPAVADPLARPPRVDTRAGQGSPFTYRAPTGQIGMTINGSTDLQTGQPLPPGTIRISAGTQDTIEGLSRPQAAEAANRDLGIERFGNTLDALVQLGQDPTNVGTAGAVRNLLQNSLASIDSVAAIFGANPNTLRQTIGSIGVGTDFRNTIPQLDTMAQLAAYQAAEALAQQSGKGLSDNDVKRFRAMLGDPTSWTSNQSEFFARVQQLKQQVAFEVGQAKKFRAGMAGRGAASAPGAPPATTEQPAAPRARIRLDAGGNVIQ